MKEGRYIGAPFSDLGPNSAFTLNTSRKPPNWRAQRSTGWPRSCAPYPGAKTRWRSNLPFPQLHAHRNPLGNPRPRGLVLAIPTGRDDKLHLITPRSFRIANSGRSFRGETLLSRTKQKTKPLTGARISNGINALVIKFSIRKNIPGGCILRRPRSCTRKGPSRQPFCPINVLWKAIRKRTNPGEDLFPALSTSNSNPTLMRVPAHASIPDARRF